MFSDSNSRTATLDEDHVKSAEAAIERILEKSRAPGGSERRRAVREPFFHPVMIEVEGCRLPAFTRDIAPPGIGLLHRFPLELGEITVELPSPDGTFRQRTLVVWCRDVGEGWHASGGRFLDPLSG